MIAMGSHFYPADAAVDRRQARCRASLLQLDGVIPINLQFVDGGGEVDGFRTVRALRQDSRTVTGLAAGARKPIVAEMFDVLAGVARTEGCRYFAYLNADIEVTPAALEIIRAADRDGVAFSRMEVDPATGAELGVLIFGLDLFAIDAQWWQRERHRFRSYIAGEACWDNVFAAILCAHGRGEVISDRPGIFHQAHPTVWNDSPFAEHNGFLATLDAPYFSRWCQYATRTEDALKAGKPIDGRRVASETLADARLSARETITHAARQLRARLKHARRRAAAIPPRSLRRSGPAER
jgi:hypothetical protein